MKLFNWIQKHKYPIMVILFFTVILLLLLTIWQAFKKDHSLDMVKQQIKLEEKARQQIQENREQWQQVDREKDRQIFDLLMHDTVYKITRQLQNEQFDKLQNRLNEKNKIINTYGSDELRDYFRNLPKQPDNDY